MNETTKKWLPLILCIGILLLSGAALGIYAQPMADVSLDLSLMSQEDVLVQDPNAFDSKGWTVYTKEGDTVTELNPVGFSGYSGLELGQTFYFSRVMVEDLDNPTIQLGAVEQTFAVWLDDVLIYTDHPELDNRIGYLTLPMNEWVRDGAITISLPLDYQGKTLTIAQSFPEYTETSRVIAFPASVRLYCGYAYESELISEAFQTAIVSAAAFAVIVILLAAFFRSRDWGTLFLSLAAFSWMLMVLTGTTFFQKYFDAYDNAPAAVLPMVFSLTLVVFLTMRAGRHRQVLWGLTGGFAISVMASGVILAATSYISAGNRFAMFLIGSLPFWLAFACLAAVLVLGAAYWRKENWFYRVFTPLAFAGIAVIWIADIILNGETVWQQSMQSLSHGQITYIFYRFLYGTAAAALITAIAEAVKQELDRRTEKRLLQQRQEMTLASYENIRRQHEEVMMLRHDMVKHFRALQAMSDESQVKSYLAELIGQNEKICTVVRTGNETLDIILNSKLSAARSSGITVEIQRAQAPASISMTDADLCSLMMNVVDNAIAAAGQTQKPYILLDIHTSNDLLAIICENSCDSNTVTSIPDREALPQHGLGLKIIEGITEKYEGVMDTDNQSGRFRVRIVIPLDNSIKLQ